MLKYLVPRLAWADLPALCGVSIVGALIAGLYGVLHDLITYSISPEYFTKLKFFQFHYANFGQGDRLFAATIGFLATWWVGFIAAWLLARRLIPGQPRRRALRQISMGIACVFAFGLSFGILGNCLAMCFPPAPEAPAWAGILHALEIQDAPSFIRVARIHNASYLGGLVGLVVALIGLKNFALTAASGGCSRTTSRSPGVPV